MANETVGIPFIGPRQTPKTENTPIPTGGEKTGIAFKPLQPVTESEAIARGMGAGLSLNQLPQATALGAAGSADEDGEVTSYIHPSQIISGAIKMGLEKLAPSYFGDNATKTYEQGIEAEKARQKEVHEAYPTTYALSNIAGATINPINKLIPAPVGGAGFVSNATRAAVPSAAIGAIEGSGEGDTWSEKGKNAIYGAIGGGTVGGLLGGIFGQFVPKPSATLPASAPSASDVASAAERLGVSVPKVVASESPGLITAAGTAAEIPFVGTPLKEAAKATTEQLGQKITELAGGETRASAGAEAKNALEGWIGQGSKDLVNKGYDAIDSLITNPATLTDLSKTRTIAQSIQDELGAANIEGWDPAVQQVLAAATNPEGLTYKGIKTLRTTIGNALDNPTDVMKSAQPSLRRLYGALTNDLETAIKNSGGQDAFDAFNSANSLATKIAANREALEKVTGVNTTVNGGEAIFNKLMNYASAGKGADIARLKLAQQVTPPEVWDKISQGAIDALSRDSGNVSNIGNFFKNYSKLSDEGRDVLFGTNSSNPAMRNALDDFATITSRIDRLNAISGKETGNVGKTGIGAAELLALAYAPFKTAIGVGTGRIFSEVMSRPVTSQSVQNWATAYERFLRTPTQATANAFGAATKSMATMVGGEYGVPSTDNVINAVIAANETGKAAAYLYNWAAGEKENEKRSGEFKGQSQSDIFSGQQGQALGGRIERATGGSVIDKKADALVNETLRNRKLYSDHTEHMLSMPDDAIVQALNIAKQFAA